MISIETLTAMSERQLLALVADKTLDSAERKRAYAVYSNKKVLGYAAVSRREADKLINAVLQRWIDRPIPGVAGSTRESLMKRSDIARLLADAAEYETAAAEWLAKAA